MLSVNYRRIITAVLLVGLLFTVTSDYLTIISEVTARLGEIAFSGL
jgi:hypothetical protein